MVNSDFKFYNKTELDWLNLDKRIFLGLFIKQSIRSSSRQTAVTIV